MKFKWGMFFLAGLLFYFVFLFVQTPAHVLNYYLPQATQNKIVLEEPTGTVWRGSASRLTITAPSGVRIPLDLVRWRWSFLALLRGELGLDVTIADVRYPGHGVLALANKRAHLKNLQAQLPVTALVAFAPQVNIWQPGGQLVVKSEDFEFAQGAIKGEAEILWKNASTNLVKVQPIGDYRLIVNGRSQGADLRLSTLSGALNLQGSGSWSQKQGLKFLGSAKAVAHQAQLADFLKIIGKDQGNGQYQILLP